MKAKKTLSESEFLKLSQSEQAKELKKMSKRANVRLSLLEEKNNINLAYRQAYQFNLDQDRENNRFSESTKYKSSKELKEKYKAVSSFLNNKSSTLKGVKDNTRDIINDMVKKDNIDMNVIKKMSKQEQKYASKYLAMASNKKLTDLEKAHIKQYAYGLAELYNKNDGMKKNRFSRSMKFKNDEDLKMRLENMAYFFNAKTSTPKGYQESIQTRLYSFREKGVIIPKEREYQFFQFLASNEFKKLGSRADSNQVIKTYNEALNEGKEVEEINRIFGDFLDTDMTFDQVQERLDTAPWQKPKFKFRKK